MTVAYLIEQANPPGDLRLVARLKCATCNNKGSFALGNMGNNPEFIGKGFARMGWDVDIFKPGKCICPRCVALRPVKRAGETPDKPTAHVFEPVKLEQVLPQNDPVQVQLSLKNLKLDEKRKLRVELDQYFDDATGLYLENQSDHTIAEKLGLTRLAVFAYRESEYGPLKRDPEMEAIGTEITSLRKLLAECQSRLTRLEDRAALAAARLNLK